MSDHNDSEFDQRISDLEGELASLRRQLVAQTEFGAFMLGRYAAAVGDAPDLGDARAAPGMPGYREQLEMLLLYNREAGL